MTYINKLWILCALILLISCNEDKEVWIDNNEDIEEENEPTNHEFDVTIDESLTFKVGEPVVFSLKGNSSIIQFYSGIVGNAYAYKDKDRYFDVKVFLSFESNQTPTNSTNLDCAELLYTSNFNGTYSYDDINREDWKPITDRFNLHEELQPTGNDFLNSSEVDISDLFEDNKSIHLAWFAKTEANSYRTQFRVRNFVITSFVVEDESLSNVLYTQAAINFQWLLNPNAANQGSNLPTSTSTLLVWNGMFNNSSGPYKEGYAVSKTLTAPQFNAGKDKPSLLFPNNDNTWDSHEFVYNKAGTYEVTLIGSHLEETAEIVKTFTITVEDDSNM